MGNFTSWSNSKKHSKSENILKSYPNHECRLKTAPQHIEAIIIHWLREYNLFRNTPIVIISIIQRNAFQKIPIERLKNNQKKCIIDYDILLKIVFVSDTGVGRSSILQRYIDDIFDNTRGSTIGVDFGIKKQIIQKLLISLLFVFAPNFHHRNSKIIPKTEV